MSDSPQPWIKLFRGGMNELGLVGVIVLLGLLLAVCGGSVERRVADPATGKVFRVTQNKFLNVERLLTLAKNTSFFAIMAVGATAVIVAGGIDLSVAAIYMLAGLAGAAFLRLCGPDGSWQGLPAWAVVPAAIFVCLGVGAACGAINGLGTVGLKLHPFIITLGTMSVFRGLGFVLTEGKTIGNFHPAFVDGFISRKMSFGAGQNLTPMPLAILLLVAFAGSVFLSRTTSGRKLLAIGGNETAARYAGLPVQTLKALTYVLCGLTAGIAAMINIGFLGAAASGDGNGYELRVVAAAVVGGASLSGGRGAALGAVLGALIIQMIDDGIVILNLDQNYSQIIIGSVIVLAAALDRWQAAWRAS